MMPVATVSRDDTCVRLWRAVLVQALMDATSNDGGSANDRRGAREYLTTETGFHARNRRLVCSHADIDQEAFDRRVAELQRRGWPRADLIMSRPDALVSVAA